MNDGNKSARILLVDDQPANLDVLCRLLERCGHRVSVAPSGRIALGIVAQSPPDLVLLDVMMPEMDGYEVCRRLKADERTRAIPVVFITARDLTEGVVEGLRAGGVDYIAKPFQEEEVLARVDTHLRLHWMQTELAERNAELERKNRELEREIAARKQLRGQLSAVSQREAEHWGLEGFVGHSQLLREISRQVRLMQEHAGISVLVTGESGTGKELIARAIHFGSERRDKPFVPVNCAAVPGELVESLLFGHAKGAFTGAEIERMGHFEAAHEGTLFLDEIGDMPLELQAKLLRVLEDGTVQRIGDRESRQVDVRVIAATNADLMARIQAGAFRQDLYFRLARFTVAAPPLRERPEDVPLLVEHFLKLFAGEMGREMPRVEAEVLARLKAYSFPGNVRELKNIVERALIESGGEPIEPHHLHFLPRVVSPIDPDIAVEGELPERLDQAEVWVIKRAIAQAGGNISEAARRLGTNRNHIYRALGQERQ